MPEFDLDGFVGDMADGLGAEQASRRPPPEGLARRMIRQAIQRASTDQQAVDKRDRVNGPKLTYRNDK